MKIEDTKIILEKMEKELDLYESLIAKGRKFINKEAINNLKNLKIFTNINFFIKKMGEISDELNNCHNFEYKKYNYRFNNYNNKINNIYNCNSEALQKSSNIENKPYNIIFDIGETKEKML